MFFFSCFAFFFGEARRRKRELKAWRARESREDTSRRRSGGETEKAWRPLRRFRRFNILEHAENLVMYLFRVKTRIFFLKDMVPWYKSGEISNYVKEKKKAK